MTAKLGLIASTGALALIFATAPACKPVTVQSGLASVSGMNNKTFVLYSKLDGADKCLDLTDGGKTDGVRLQFWQCNRGPNQQWTFIADATDPAKYFIRSVTSGKVVDLTDGQAGEGTELQQWTYDKDNKNQMFWLDNVKMRATNVQYVIKPILSNTRCMGPVLPTAGSMQAGVKAVIRDCQLDGNGQLIELEPIEPSTTVVDTTATTPGATTTAGTTGAATTTPTSTSTTATPGATTATTMTSTTSTTPAASTTAPAAPILDGKKFVLYSKLEGVDLCLDLKNGGTTNGTALQLATCTQGVNQQFKVTASAGDPTQFLLTSVKSGKALDLKDGKTAAGTELQQWTLDKANRNQMFSITNSKMRDTNIQYLIKPLLAPTLCVGPIAPAAGVAAAGAAVVIRECATDNSGLLFELLEIK